MTRQTTDLDTISRPAAPALANLTQATAIEQAGLTPTSAVETPDRIEFPNGAVINDSENHPTENLTLTGGLVESSNVAMSQFGTTVSP